MRDMVEDAGFCMSCDGEALGVGSKVPMGRRWWMGGLEGAG